MPEPQISAWALAQGGAWGMLLMLLGYMAKVLWADLRATLGKREGDVEKLTNALNAATAAQLESASATRALARAVEANTDFSEKRAEAIDDFREQARRLLERAGAHQ